jgi:EAL domain-containing protein (putative c-di-GMP-specific phosphodiesterase class I)
LVEEPHDGPDPSAGLFDVGLEAAGLFDGGPEEDSLEAAARDSVSSLPPDPRVAEARLRIEHLLEEGTLRVAFQPIVDLSTKNVIGYEALARFPGDSGISPQQWFADAARVGIQQEIEMAAIKAALDHLAELPSDAFISLNVSPVTAGSEELRDALVGVDGSRVVLEINENAAAEGYDQVTEAIGVLRSSGVRIALDDTGSGTVSFSNLYDVHADIIKIDIEVTRGIDADPMKQAMASALKALADRSGAMSLAEGIETEEELEMLRGLGVQAGQGYLFGRPESMDE